MQFIEMTGRVLLGVIDKDEPDAARLRASGIDDASIVRVNRHGDIELRKADRWDVVGGLLGDYEQRIRKATGLDWA